MRLLFDSNVLIAYFDEAHVHHVPSFAAIEAAEIGEVAMSAHSLCEAYNKLSRSTIRAASARPALIANALRDFAASVEVLSLTTEQTLSSIETFAGLGGTGARLYDFLIGQIAALHRVSVIVTWDTRHMRPLFPQLRILTPTELLETM